MTPRIGSLFSGYGGLDLGVVSVIGGEVVWHAEHDDAPSRILARHWPGVPNLGDVTKVDWATVHAVDVLLGGFPCQDLSLAGRRAGMRPGTRSGLWADYLKAITVLRPHLVVIENVRGLLSGCAESDLESCPGCLGVSDVHRPVLRAIGRVLADLSRIGYDAVWKAVRASDVGAPHERFRVFVLAWRAEPEDVADADGVGRDGWGEEHRGIGLQPTVEGDHPVTPDSGDGTGHGKRARPESGQGGADAAAHAEGFGLHWGRVSDEPTGASGQSRDAGEAESVADAERAPGEQGRAADAGEAESGRAPGQPRRRGQRHAAVNWGPYRAAVERWERVTGNVAPSPVKHDGRNDNARLSAEFSEWMMGIPHQWVTDPAIWEGYSPNAAREAILKALGNGVVPQQAALAVAGLLSYVPPRILMRLGLN